MKFQAAGNNHKFFWKCGNIHNSKMQKNLSVFLLNALHFFVFIFSSRNQIAHKYLKDTQKTFLNSLKSVHFTLEHVIRHSYLKYVQSCHQRMKIGVDGTSKSKVSLAL